MPVNPSIEYTNAALKEFSGDATTLAIRVVPSTTFLKGQLLALTAPANDVQTITGNTNITSGQYRIKVWGMLSDWIDYNGNAAAIQAALAAIPAIGSTANVGVTGGHLGTATPIVITFQGALAYTPVMEVEVVTTNDDGSANLGGSGISTITVDHTTVGVSEQTMAKYDSTVIAVPTTAIVPSAVAGGSIADGAYRVYYAGKNSRGGTTLSAQTGTVTLTGGSNTIRIAAMAGLPSGLTHLEVYIASLSGAAGGPRYLGTIAVSGTSTAQTDFTALPAATATKSPATSNTAYSSSANTACMILEYDCISDDAGKVAVGNAATGTGEHGEKQDTISAFECGKFQISELIGLDAKALADMRGVVLAGSISSGEGLVKFS